METDAQSLAEFGVGLAGPHQGVTVAGHDGVHGAAFGDAAAEDPLDPMLDHEVQGPLGAALDGLPALHREGQGPGDQGQLLEGVASVRHLGRQRVVRPFMGERLVVERLEDDLHRFFELLPVGVLVRQGRTKGLHLAGMVAAPDAEDHPSLG